MPRCDERSLTSLPRGEGLREGFGGPVVIVVTATKKSLTQPLPSRERGCNFVFDDDCLIQCCRRDDRRHVHLCEFKNSPRYRGDNSFALRASRRCRKNGPHILGNLPRVPVGWPCCPRDYRHVRGVVARLLWALPCVRWAVLSILWASCLNPALIQADEFISVGDHALNSDF